MNVKCWYCRGSGRVRRSPVFNIGEAIVSMGMIPLIRSMMESDDRDCRFWRDCHICHGNGWTIETPPAGKDPR